MTRSPRPRRTPLIAVAAGIALAVVLGIAVAPAQAATTASASGWKGHPGRTVKHYTVRAGDTPSGIATRFHAWTAELYQINHKTSSSSWYVGERILVPVVTKRVPKAAKHPRAHKPAQAHKKHKAHKAHPKKRAPKTPSKRAVRNQIIRSARSVDVDPKLALAIAWQESGWQMDVKSHTGAIGAMQVMPANKPWLQVVLGRPLKLTDLRDNVASGMTILRLLLQQHGVKRSVAAYYQGIGSIAINGPTKDTRHYTKSVLAIHKRLVHGWHPLAK